MRYVVILLIVLSIVFVLPAQSFALSCAIPPFDEAFKRHDLLLHGKLVEKTTPPLATKETTLVFETINVYKGESQNQFTVKADLSWDDYYREGEEYILFADKMEDHYFRDLCVGNYIATNDILKFLDDYVAGKSTGNNVNGLYDVVSIFEMNQLESKMNLYTKINRGNVLLNNLINDKTEYDYSCNFEEDLKQVENLFADNVYVFNKLRDTSHDYTITTDATLSTNPQTGLVVIESPEHKAIISILNSQHFENCFFVYNQKLIDKTTGELDVHRDSLEKMCNAENSTAILPDLCKPLNTFDINDILYIVVPLVVFGVISLVFIIYKRRK
ncbi:hypothetical protein [Nitrosopumilus piranensis]|uniref:Uncharacterized protein n=1 Tax=Nitrosopumilus piranensis TaxID=1582439 RepID=A0A0C5BW70_9ARCH|nr:hypothetical protein [Nitrosopumilus piranensis]AJM92484.1 exported protein of unknown function [Nitrosopumilus piranensis]